MSRVYVVYEISRIATSDEKHKKSEEGKFKDSSKISLTVLGSLAPLRNFPESSKLHIFYFILSIQLEDA